MNTILAIVLAIAILSCIAINGVYMIVSPVGWASAFWTARGIYGNPEARQRLSSVRERRRIRFIGVVWTLMSIYGLLILLSAYI